MRFLLDTHAFLWFILDDKRLSQRANELIQNPANPILISPASYWEIAIKIRLGKYKLPGSFEQFVQDQLSINQMEILHILPSHTQALTTMPFHHRDPFDRLLVAQSLTENIPILGADRVFDLYGVARHW